MARKSKLNSESLMDSEVKNELERQLNFIEEKYKDNPKYASRKAEIEAKLGLLKKSVEEELVKEEDVKS